MPRAKNGNLMNPKKRGRCKAKGAFNIPELPLAIVMDILSRLSFKTLCSCRCVCKDWLHIISDPEFAHLHRPTLPLSILIKTQPPNRKLSRLDLFHVEKSAGSRIKVDRLRFDPQKSIPCSLSEVILINSCDGLVCLTKGTLWKSRDGSLYVCNPIWGRYISIPSPDKNRTYDNDFTAIGFSAKTKEYKVVQTSTRNDCHETEVLIYTIGTGAWRSLGKSPKGSVAQLPFNSFLHGALHYVLGEHPCSQVIQCFDFEREEFRPLLAPAYLKKVNRFRGCYWKVGVLEGCMFLFVFDDNAGTTSEMWIMKDYGVQESWTKIFVLENSLFSRASPSYYEPILFLNDMEILMTEESYCVVCYNQETKCFKKTSVVRTESRFQALGYYPSFVSLQDVSNGEEVRSVLSCLLYDMCSIRDNIEIDILRGGGSSSDVLSSVPPDHNSG
ncbi:F-box/kelch-repeat protein At3g23880-like [Argentina anserina]|uniref:F-box/kelch-repeat protein At3g23880-like n=1 Tax=Argentina anserina TaxID=57926 RepID=UPI00217692DA|nr:F-box/kelch-repeat protein At3g23880-like [Potentilla anserina]